MFFFFFFVPYFFSKIRIYAFDPLNLTQAAPLNIYSDKRMICDTFFVHLAVSPCSRYLSCGSSDGGVYLFDTEGQGNDAVKLTGHEQETVAVDWGKDKVRFPFFSSKEKITKHRPFSLFSDITSARN